MSKSNGNKSSSQKPSNAPEPPIKSIASSITAMFVEKNLKERGIEIPSLKIKIEKQDKKD